MICFWYNIIICFYYSLFTFTNNDIEEISKAIPNNYFPLRYLDLKRNIVFFFYH